MSIPEDELALVIESKVQLMKSDLKELATILDFKTSGSISGSGIVLTENNIEDTEKIILEAEG